MRTYIVFLSTCWAVLAHFSLQNYNGILQNHLRHKREVSGALEIITNHAQPIHAEVKPENSDVTEKVTPPKDAVYEVKSLRKSWPLTSKLDLIRSITRVVTLAILVLSAAIEFYPLIQHLYFLYYV